VSCYLPYDAVALKIIQIETSLKVSHNLSYYIHYVFLFLLTCLIVPKSVLATFSNFFAKTSQYLILMSLSGKFSAHAHPHSLLFEQANASVN